jgi:hypothetical protein
MLLGLASAGRQAGRKRMAETKEDVLSNLAFPGQAIMAGGSSLLAPGVVATEALKQPGELIRGAGSSLVAPLEVTSGLTGEALNTLINSLTIAQTPNQVSRLLGQFLGIPQQQLTEQMGPAFMAGGR